MSASQPAAPKRSVFLQNLHYFLGKTDGSYSWPDGCIGRLLREAKAELEAVFCEPVDTAEVFYLQRLGEFNGDFLVWCGPNNCGYTTSLEQAGEFTEQLAESIRARAPDCVRIWSKAEALMFAQHAVSNEALMNALTPKTGGKA